LLPAFEGKEEYINYLKENDLFDTGKGGLPYFTTYTTDDGLAMNWVTCATVDKRGHIWFGTWGQGISKFDGLRFTNYSIANGLQADLISSIIEDRNGNIWIGSIGQGVSCYDGMKFTKYLIGGEAPNRRVRNMTEGQSGKIWINTDAGIKFYDPESDSIINLNTTKLGLTGYTFNCLEADKNGNIWIGTNNGVICFVPVNNQVIYSFTTKNGLVNNNVNGIHEDKKGNIWIATDDGVSCYEPEHNGKLTNYSTTNPFVSNTFISISEDSKGRLWFGSDDGEVSRFENHGTDSKFTRYDALTKFGIFLTADSSDKLWFGTYNSGVICISPPVTGGSGSFIYYSRDQGLPYNNISNIYKDKKGNLWFGSENIIRFDGTHFTYYTPEQGVPPMNFSFISEDRSGKIWFGGWGASGVYCYVPATNGKGESFTRYTNEQGFHGNFLSSLKTVQEIFGLVAGITEYFILTEKLPLIIQVNRGLAVI
jgi:ligand-binding sensor domain-containing protein